MIDQILNLILDSAEAAFLEVGVFVGAVLLLFGFINYKKSGAFIETIKTSQKFQPVIGAFLGLTPGCGGAIFVMPLFFKGAVTFGTVTATLIATMGDAAFVLLASSPLHYFLISAISFVVAIITGYVVDKTGLGESILNKYKMRKKDKVDLDFEHKQYDHVLHEYECEKMGCKNGYTHIGHEEGDEIDLLLHHELKGHMSHETFGYRFTHSAFYIYWFLMMVGLPLGIALLFQVDINELTNINLGHILGTIGITFSIIMTIMSKKFLDHESHEEAELKVMSLKETFVHNALDTAFVITWVFIGFLAYEFGILGLGAGDYALGEATMEGFLLATGILSVLIGAAIGLIPGCGPQIVFVALFTRGLIPFAALFANAVSQDGDALLPLLAIDRRSAIWATVISTIPAIIFGLLIYYFEIRWFN
ncbi:putative manganese transporter [Serpentinicella alkaliphila]|uniref:Putative 10TM heavy-metal exporter n=1 Tax=Serpentinicella alkaliphila TaxID=1734049 RepID=A0A4R2T2U0_9FIRM|nr:putative manganese transporter [Serpentinicella alkaliphila]QUH25517.1 arsenic efflux protein [Serpentinicella alkaliphila]TCP95144.1 putative 10TM heavy-metal exporter [Serpentinicella alkaliphila]